MRCLYLKFNNCYFSEYLSTLNEDKAPRHTSSSENTCVLGLDKLWHKTQKTFINDARPGQFCVAVVLDVSSAEEVASSPIAQAFADAIYNFTGFVKSLKIIKF